MEEPGLPAGQVPVRHLLLYTDSDTDGNFASIYPDAGGLPGGYAAPQSESSSSTYPLCVQLGKQTAYNIVVDGQIRGSSLVELLIVMIIGIALFFVSRLILNFIAYMWGEFARFMLSRNSVGQPLDAREGDLR